MDQGPFDSFDTLITTREESSAYTCSCGESLRSTVDVKRHTSNWKRKHNHDQRCPHPGCNTSTTTVSNTKRHFRNMHLHFLMPAHGCPRCGVVYKHEKGLKKHVAGEACAFRRKKMPRILDMLTEWQVGTPFAGATLDAKHEEAVILEAIVPPNASWPRTAGPGLTTSSIFDIKSIHAQHGANEALNDVFGDVNRGGIDPSSYHNSNEGWQPTPLPLASGTRDTHRTESSRPQIHL